MSRIRKSLHEAVVNPDGSITEHPIVLYSGNDMILGKFLDITDSRFAGSEQDKQGEGYLFEWSEVFGISTNLIGLTEKSMKDEKQILHAVESYLTKIGVLKTTK